MFKKGLWTACITPFTSEGNIDYPSFESLIKRQVEAGNGLLILGSTGESNSLTMAERRDVITFMDKLGMKGYMVGIPSFLSLQETQKFIKFCNDFDIAGYLAPVPPYSKPGPIGQTNWFLRILDASSKDVMLYNIPSRSSCPLYASTLENLREHKNMQAVKDSGGSVNVMKDYLVSANNVKIFCGDDDMATEMIKYGATGLISVASNIWPHSMNKFVNYCLERSKNTEDGNNIGDEGDDVGHSITEVSFRSLFSASNPIPAKAIMKKLGIISSDTARPPLSCADMSNWEGLNELNEIMCEFEKKCQSS